MASTHGDDSARLAYEDESEWEYEYSNTETETFYVTLDLSTADFTGPHKNVVSNVRTDYQGNRLTESERIRRKNNESIPDASEGIPDPEEDDEGMEAQQQEQEQDQRRRDQSRSPEEYPATQQNGAGEEPDTSELSEKVQIMELHSPNPVISYKGRVYEGQWSQNVGTELLLTRHDSGGGGAGSAIANVNANADPLPAVRHLGNGVDLLAASSARITVTQREPERRDAERRRQRKWEERAEGLDRDEREALTREIPRPETKPSGARLAQSGFLARLIALKRRRGEPDAVPVLVNGHVRDLYVGGARRRKGAATGRGGRRPGSGKGKGGAMVRTRTTTTATTGAGTGTGITSKGEDAAGGIARADDSAPRLGPRSGAVAAGLPADSTPTPTHWDDLREAGAERRGGGSRVHEDEADGARGRGGSMGYGEGVCGAGNDVDMGMDVDEGGGSNARRGRSSDEENNDEMDVDE